MGAFAARFSSTPRFFSGRFDRRHRVLLWTLAIGAFLLCWLLLTLLILLAQDALLGPLLLAPPPMAPPGMDPDSYAGRGIQLLVGHFNGNLPAERAANLSSEELNANLYSPRAGAGEQGRPVELSLEEEERSERTFGINQFNLLASDLIPLNRSLPDVRRSQCKAQRLPTPSELPDTSVIIVFHNEAFSTLARTVTSVVNRSPHSLLRELILVDDFSTRAFLGTQLESFLRQLPVRAKLIRARQRVGLIRARLMGAQEASGQVLTFLDSHCECTLGWLEPLLARVRQEPKAVVCPVIDVINDRSFAYQKGIEMFRGGFNWQLQFRWYSLPAPVVRQRHKSDPTAPIPSPTMAGGLFSMDRQFFLQMGSYDPDMDIWGGENLEMSFRVWQCGGRVEILPCSHVGHIFRHASPHDFPRSNSGRVLNANLARVSEVWMGSWRHFFHKVTPQALALVPSLDVSERVELKKRLACRDFGWYLDQVWPDHFLPVNGQSLFGRFRHSTSDSCLLSRPSSAGKRHRLSLGPCSLGFDLWQFWVLTRHRDGAGLRLMSDEHQCLSAAEEPAQPGQWRLQLRECGEHEMEFWRLDRRWGHFVHLKSGLCLDDSGGSGRFFNAIRDDDFEVDDAAQQARLPKMKTCGRSRHSQQWEVQQVRWFPSDSGPG